MAHDYSNEEMSPLLKARIEAAFKKLYDLKYEEASRKHGSPVYLGISYVVNAVEEQLQRETPFHFKVVNIDTEVEVEGVVVCPWWFGLTGETYSTLDEVKDKIAKAVTLLDSL